VFSSLLTENLMGLHCTSGTRADFARQNFFDPSQANFLRLYEQGENDHEEGMSNARAKISQGACFAPPFAHNFDS
jgi:hypothetical protein